VETVAAQCSGGDGVEVLPVTWLRPCSRSGLGFVGGESGSGQSRALSRRPPHPFIAQGDGDPPAKDRLDAPDQGASQGKKAVGLSIFRRTLLTFSPLISSFTLIFELLF
jgi:hypothetical protein